MGKNINSLRATHMAASSNSDIFQSIREAVGQTLEMAEAESKISDETKEMLSQLMLTRKGTGEIVLDMSAHQKAQAQSNQWTNKERQEQDRYLNPTRLPQVIPGLSGLSSGQYLAFVQRPLDRSGENGPFLAKQSLRILEQYSAKELAAEKNKLFGRQQRYVAKMAIDQLLSKKHNIKDQAQLDKLRSQTSPQDQFELAASEFHITTNEVMIRLSKFAVAATLVERIKIKAIQLKKAESQFELMLRKLGSASEGAVSKTRIKEMFIGFKNDLNTLARELTKLNHFFDDIFQSMDNEKFDPAFQTYHKHAAIIDAVASRWVIIMSEAKRNDNSRSLAEQIKGMHSVFES
jgi:hypothetical protein